MLSRASLPRAHLAKNCYEENFGKIIFVDQKCSFSFFFRNLPTFEEEKIPQIFVLKEKVQGELLLMKCQIPFCSIGNLIGFISSLEMSNIES